MDALPAGYMAKALGPVAIVLTKRTSNIYWAPAVSSIVVEVSVVKTCDLIEDVFKLYVNT